MTKNDFSVKFESVKENEDGSHIYKIRAISATVTGNRRDYTERELPVSARSLSFRPLNINHDHSEWLGFPENQTEVMDWDAQERAVVGTMKISDPQIIEMIDSGKIKKLSIEQVPYKGETCDRFKCIQNGIIFTALALLTEGVRAGDESTYIKRIERLEDIIDKHPELLEEKQSEDSSLESDCPCKHKDMETQTKTEAETTKVQETKVESTKVYESVDIKTLIESVEKSNGELLTKFAEQMGIIAESLKPKAKEESSSDVQDKPANTYFESAIKTPAEFFEAVRLEKSGSNDFIQWQVPKEELLGQLGLSPNQIHQEKRYEAISITAGDKPIIYDQKIILLPNGEMVTSVRPYCDVQVIDNARTFQWWTGNGFDVDDTASEGTEPSNESQTIAKITVTPTIRRSVQTVNVGDIEEMPYSLIDYFNQSAIRGAINVENDQILNVLLDAQTPDNADNTKLAWIRGDGTNITSDDIATNTLDPKAFTKAISVLAKRGFNVMRGNVVAFLHPIAIQQLADAVDGDYSTKDFSVSLPEITQYVERRYGIEIVPATKVKLQDNTTDDQYRNYIMVKGAVGIGVGSNLTLEAQKKTELSAIKVSARHKIAGAVLLAGGIVRVSTHI